jgi:bifunctional UDP-N-acetylglucosamine pyrophosphorylase/glucosamine-1-phosphate N-acetyltransferase
MLVMTGTYEGAPEDNYYGRIIKTRQNNNEVIEIKEHKDILAMYPDKPYCTTYRGKEEQFTKNELLNIREFNTGVYVFRIDPLKEFISYIRPDNVQGEIYITDLIKIFNDKGLRVCASRVTNNNLVIAFNVKSVLKRMDETFREIVYERLKDIITIDDSDDFFIAEETIEKILQLDKQHRALDIKIGKGAYLGPDIEIKRGLWVERNAILKGNIRVGENVRIDEASMFSTYADQTIDIGDNSHIFRGNVIQGSVKIGKNVRIETGVRITGSTEYPVVIGDNVQIKGMTYIFGSVIEGDLLIEHSILKNKLVEKVIKKNGEVQPIKYILPHPEGLDSISNLGKDKPRIKTDM